MESLMDDQQSESLARHLHEANSRLTLLLNSLMPNSQATPVAASPQQMTELLSELMRTGEWLCLMPSSPEPVLEQELCDYRKTVTRLRDLLPSIHGALLRERMRIEQERARIAVAAEWAIRSRQTL